MLYYKKRWLDGKNIDISKRKYRQSGFYYCMGCTRCFELTTCRKFWILYSFSVKWEVFAGKAIGRNDGKKGSSTHGKNTGKDGVGCGVTFGRYNWLQSKKVFGK